ERDRVLDLDPVLTEVVHAEEGAAAALAELHDHADIVLRGEDRGLHDVLTDALDLSRGKLARVRDCDGLLVVGRDLIDDAGRRRNDVEVELAPETLRHDLEVQEAEEATAKPEAEGDGCLGLVVERSIRELQFVERLT